MKYSPFWFRRQSEEEVRQQYGKAGIIQEEGHDDMYSIGLSIVRLICVLMKLQVCSGSCAHFSGIHFKRLFEILLDFVICILASHLYALLVLRALLRT